jgi:hypothetical protein
MHTTLAMFESEGTIFAKVSPSTMTEFHGFSFHDNLPTMLMDTFLNGYGHGDTQVRRSANKISQRLNTTSPIIGRHRLAINRALGIPAQFPARIEFEISLQIA